METIKFIESKGKFGMKLGLDNIRLLLEKLGHPEEQLTFIHVAGSNGKGSICTILESVLTEANIKTGTYISPHLEHFNERIRINKEEISNETIERLFSLIKEKCQEILEETGQEPTAFEIETAMALLYFLENNCDICILEVGLGGRLDATNAIPSPLISIISHISLEHTKWLGNSLKEIASEKGGIIKEGTNLIVAPQEEEALEELERIAEERAVNSLKIVREDNNKKLSEDINGQNLEFTIDNRVYQYKTPLHGNYQLDNIATSLNALEVLRDQFKISEDHIKNGLLKVSYPGRFEILLKDPTVILDGAHNFDGIKSLVKSYEALFKDKKVKLIFGMIREKDIDSCIKEVLKISEEIYLLEPNSEEALSSEEMYKRIREINSNIPIIILKNYKELKPIIESSKFNVIYLCTGSLYLVGEVRKVLK